jgi:UDP-N-acetyl-D-mannosaminuronic acid transferase (WecB/TagA/CpsF family)
MNAASALRAQPPADTELRLPVPAAIIGGLPIAVINRADCARLMVELATARRNQPGRALVFTSANGQVLSMCEASPDIRALFLACDLINADGMPLVFASHLLSDRKLPERVATTDLVYDVAEMAQEREVSFYLLGAAAGVIEQAAEHLRRLYPRLAIVGCRHGYFSPEEEADVVAAIDDARPDILWLGLGVPAEQRFALATGCASGSSRRRVVCSTFSPARTGARRSGCRGRASNGLIASISSRGGCSAGTSGRTRMRCFYC